MRICSFESRQNRRSKYYSYGRTPDLAAVYERRKGRLRTYALVVSVREIAIPRNR